MFNRKALKEHRNRLNLSQAELAAKLNVTQAAVCQWERGKKTPIKKDIRNIARVLDAPLDELDIPEEKVLNIMTDFNNELSNQLKNYTKHVSEYLDDHFNEILSDVEISDEDIDALWSNLDKVLDKAEDEFLDEEL